MEFDEIIEKRHSVRSFKTTKKPDYKDVLAAVYAATKAPLAGNLPCMKYVVVTDKKKISKLADAAQQEFIAEAHYVIIVCSDKSFLEKNFLDRTDMYSRQQAGAAVENILLKLVDVGLSGCWVGAFADDMVRRVIGIPGNVVIEALIPLGYEMGKTKSPQRPDINSLVFFDGFGSDFKYMGGRYRTPGSKS
jgi:nitroreductase